MFGRLKPNTRETASETQERVWKQHGYVAISIDDPQLPWDLREQLARFMTRRHGIRNGQGKRP
jgi:hypothetical protein